MSKFMNLLKNTSIIILCIFSIGVFASQKNNLQDNSIVVVNELTQTTTCLECHGVKGFAIPTTNDINLDKRKLFINPKYSI